jgi:hypothetical protein
MGKSLRVDNMSQIGALSVKIGADTKDLTKGLSEAKGEIGGLDSSIKNMLPSIKQIALVGAAAAAALGVMVKRAIDTADSMGKAAQKVGVTTEELSKLEYAAKLANVSSGELQSSLMRLTKGMSDAAQGTGEAQKGFSALGIQVKASDGSLKSSTQVMGEVADRFAGMRDGAEKTALAISIFGRAGANMIPLLNGGSKAIKEAGDELERMGGVVTAQAARQAEQFNDNITRLKETFSGLVMQLANKVLPALTTFTEKILAAIRHGLDLGAVVRLMFSGDEEARLVKINARLAEFAVLAQKGRMGLAQVLDEESLMKEKKALEDVIKARQDSLNKLKELEQSLAKPAGPSLAANEEQKKLEEERAKMLQQLADQEAANEQRRRDDIAATLEARRLTYATEAELELERYARELQNLMDAQAIEFLTEEQHRAMKEQAEQRHYENLANIRTRGSSQLIKIAEMFRKQDYEGTVSGLAQITAATASSNKKMFNMNKAFAIAEAVIKGYKAVLDAYAWGNDKGGPPLGAAMAALAGAFAFAQVRAISSQQFSGTSASGGGVAPSVGAAAGGAVPVTNVGGGGGGGGGSSGQTVTIQLQGEVFNREQVRNLITQINEAVSDGSVLRLQ